MSEVGRPSELTEELTLKIRALVLDSVPYKDIQEILEIAPGTWDHWVYVDYEGFRGKLNQWKKERIVKKAEVEIESLIGYEDKRVSLNAATFALETLGKENYSKRTETDITTGGKPLTNSLKELTNEELGAIIVEGQGGAGKEGAGE